MGPFAASFSSPKFHFVPQGRGAPCEDHPLFNSFDNMLSRSTVRHPMATSLTSRQGRWSRDEACDKTSLALSCFHASSSLEQLHQLCRIPSILSDGDTGPCPQFTKYKQRPSSPVKLVSHHPRTSRTPVTDHSVTKQLYGTAMMTHHLTIAW